MNIDYDLVLERYTDYKASPYKSLRSLSQAYNGVSETKNRIFDRVSQANTEGSQCALGDGDVVRNYVENIVVGNIAQMLPPDATDREVVDQVFLGGISLAHLIHCASDAEWARVLDGRGNQRSRIIFRQLNEVEKNKMDCYHICIVNADTGNLLQGFITKHKASPHIEAYLSQASGGYLTVWYGYQKAEELNSCQVLLPE